jgi:catechol 2,3-dioxygenase-like lactoylglutathione lyase family enzyme
MADTLIVGFDHFVLTVRDMPKSIAFYRDVLGMRLESFAQGRVALRFGRHKINLHQAGAEIAPHAEHPLPGSADFCLITKEPLDVAAAHLKRAGISILEGPVRRTGALGPIHSLYVRDPDQNLVEIAGYTP